MWQWLREGQKFSWGIVGALVLVLYGVIPTFQPSHFGRVYAVYDGFFIVLSLIWGGWWTEMFQIDLFWSEVR
jgi:small multidrug resistance family-3 protein